MPSIVQIALVVRDYDEAIAFYTEVLDFELLEDTHIPEQGKRWVVVAPRNSSGCALLLAKASSPAQENAIGNQAGGRVFLFLSTDDIARDFARLTHHQVKIIREPTPFDFGIAAVFEDLYGNLWDLIEHTPAHRYAQQTV